MVEDIRVCRACKQEKPDSEFYGGGHRKCKECFKARYRDQQAQYRRANRDEINRRTRERIAENREEYNSQCRAEYHAKYRATILAKQKAKRDADPESHREYHRQHYKGQREKDPEHVRRVQKRSWIKIKYNITLDQFEEMVKQIDGKCEICGRVTETTMCIDHCHKTGVVRGLLCRSCNTGLGNFKDDKNVLVKAIKYLASRGCD